MSRIHTIPTEEVKEAIATVVHQYFDDSLNIVVAKVTTVDKVAIPSGNITKTDVLDMSKGLEDVAVSKHNYRALMSGNPSWATSKSIGSYSEEDLWAVVDAQRTGTDLAIGTEV